MKALQLKILLTAAMCQTGAAEPPFSLTDSGPGSEAFEKHFTASYGTHAEIEPPVDHRDRKLYQDIAPLLEDQPAAAIKMILKNRGDDHSVAFDFLLGNLYVELDELDKAKRSLLRAIETFPSFRRAWRTLGIVYIRQEAYHEAAKAWRKVIALGAGDDQAYGLLAYALLAQEKPASALTAYRMARMHAPDREDFLRGEAHCLWLLDRQEEASALLNELIADHPEDATYWLMQANTYLRLEAFPNALANLEIVRHLGKADTQALLLAGDLYLRRNMTARGMQAYHAAINKTPLPDLSAALSPFDHLLRHEAYREAKAYLVAIRSAWPEADDPNLLLVEARVSLADGEMENAKKYVQHVLETRPLNGRALLILAEIQQKDEAVETALLTLERAARINDVEHQARMAMARIHVAARDYEKALPLLRKVQRSQPSEPLAVYIRQLETVANLPTKPQ